MHAVKRQNAEMLCKIFHKVFDGERVLGLQIVAELGKIFVGTN